MQIGKIKVLQASIHSAPVAVGRMWSWLIGYLGSWHLLCSGVLSGVHAALNIHYWHSLLLDGFKSWGQILCSLRLNRVFTFLQYLQRKLPCCRSGQASPTAVPQPSGPPPQWAGSAATAELGLQHMQPWFYSGMSREEASQLLLKHGTVDGVFLVRQSLTKPGSYVLCYVYRGKVHHVQIISVSFTSVFNMTAL